MEREDVAACPHCQSTALHRWGIGLKKMRRWRCCDCRRNFSATTGTLLAGLHAPVKFASVVIDMLSDDPSSCRALAAKLNVSRMTAWAWRRRISAAFAGSLENNGEPAETDVVDAGTLVTRESRKASREWVDHRRAPAIYPEPDRLRWVDYGRSGLPLPNPMSKFLVPVTLLQIRSGDCHAIVSPPATNAPITTGIGDAEGRPAPFRMMLEAETSPLTDAESSTSGFSKAAIVGQSTCGPIQEPACSNQLLDCLRQFLRLFRGPATKYLLGYVAWFIARLTASDNVRLHLILQRLWTKREPQPIT